MGMRRWNSSRPYPVAEMIDAQLLTEAFAPAERLRTFEARLGTEMGAVVTFTGLARAVGKDGGQLSALFLEHHPTMTEQSLRRIAADGAERFGVPAIDVAHRCGAIAPGEAIVWVAVASPHRRAAFEAADYLMDRLKTEAMFWKREDGPGGSTWIEPTEADHRERARWES